MTTAREEAEILARHASPQQRARIMAQFDATYPGAVDLAAPSPAPPPLIVPAPAKRGRARGRKPPRDPSLPPLEDEFQDEFVEYARDKCGYVCDVTLRSKTPAKVTAKGRPDVFLLHPTRLRTYGCAGDSTPLTDCLWVELKAHPGKPVSVAQAQMLIRLTRAGFECHVWTPEDWPEIRKRLGG